MPASAAVVPLFNQPNAANQEELKKQRKPKKVKSKYPVHKGSLRPFRIWVSKERKALAYRNYAHSWSAIDGAWTEIQWAKANTSFEVFDITNGKHVATFTRHPGGHYDRFVKSDFNFRWDRKKGRKRK